MAWQAASKNSSDGVGISSHKQAYKPGTLQGNWFEQRQAGDPLPKESLAKDSVSHLEFGHAQDKIEAAKQYERVDLGRGRTDESGKCFVAARDANGEPLPCYATVSQLAYGARGAAAEPQQVQQFLWTGHKRVDLGIPAGLPSGDARAEELTATKTTMWQQDATPEPFTTTKALASRPVEAALANGETGKRASSRPSDDSGAPAPVGRKANGEFAKGLDADWHHTGLRDAITAKGAKLAPVPAAR